MELQLKLVYVNITVSLDCVKIKKILITKINCSVVKLSPFALTIKGNSWRNVGERPKLKNV